MLTASAGPTGSALRAAGYRVGETPKPHLVTYRERIVVDGQPIDAATFARLVGTVLPLADRIAPRLGPPTEFELLTAVMFRHFAEAGLDVALVEVGLGGRLDATHAWDGGVAVLTNVGLDHTDRLGPTVTAIAREKAAIIERGDVAVTGATGDGLAVIRRRCARLGVPLTIAGPAPVLGWDRDTQRVSLPGLGPTDIALRGRHQAANVAVADALLDALEAAGIARTPAAARRRGYATARWPGRLELVDVATPAGPREVLLDGAHNPDGAVALARALEDLRPYLAGGRTDPPPPPVLVWASMADKDVPSIVAAIAASPAVVGRDRGVHGPRRPTGDARRRACGRLAGRAPGRDRPRGPRPRPCAGPRAGDRRRPGGRGRIPVPRRRGPCAAGRRSAAPRPGGGVTRDEPPVAPSVVPARPEAGGGASTPSFRLPAGASRASPERSGRPSSGPRRSPGASAPT